MPSITVIHPLPSIPFLFFVSACLSIMLLSGDVLALAGYDYASAGSSILYKLHPSFYLVFISFVSLLFHDNGRIFLLVTLLRRDIAKLLLLIFACFLYKSFWLGQPMTSIIVTWLTPVLIVAMFITLSQSQKKTLYDLLLITIFVNFLVGIFEYAQGASLVPRNYYSMEAGEMLDLSEWRFQRATAFWGHPLTATLVTCVILVGLYAKSLSFRASRLEKVTFWMGLIALPAFGGRTSIAITLLFLLLLSSMRVWNFITGGLTTHLKAARSIALVFISVLLFFVLYSLGLFDSIIARLEDDSGSAETRLIALQILFDTPVIEWVFGDIYGKQFARQILYDTVYGIEISWLAMLLQSGMITTIPLLIVLYRLFNNTRKLAGNHIAWPGAAFVLAISSGTGLSSKTLALSIAVILALFVLSAQAAKPAMHLSKSGHA